MIKYDYTWEEGNIDNVSGKLDSYGEQGYKVIWFTMDGFAWRALMMRERNVI